VIVWQHGPEDPALEQAVWRLLGPRLRGASGGVDPLLTLRAGMERLAVRDADQRVAERLVALVKR
jgi:UDP-N-acetylglucosamine--N-acetylmuramyl-(pentapeptide) pyrophosphoryl-undecaprenol N-acetylglucosamine transferase